MPIEYLHVTASDSWNNSNDRTEPLQIESSYSESEGITSLRNSKAHITFPIPQVARPENIMGATLDIYPLTKSYYNIDTTWSTINILSEPGGVLLGKTAYKNISYAAYQSFYLDPSTMTDLSQLLIDRYKHSTDSKQNKMLLEVSSSRTSRPPKLEIEYGDVQLFPENCTPMSGLVLRDTETTFSWECISDIPQVPNQPSFINAKYAWRVKGQSDITEIQTGSSSVKLPANTLPRGEVEWRVTIISNFGSATSEWFTVSTIDSPSTAQPISPIGVYLEGNKPNTFSWKHIIATGTMQSGAELQTSPNGIDWRPLKTVTGAVQQTDIPANTLLGDTRFWRVRTKNRDGVAGSWSEAAPIVVYAAPRPPAVTLPEGLPRLTVTWQSEEQQAFEVSADSWKSGTVYGTTKIYDFPQWFSDGPVTVGVRVQSALGLWSNWATVRVTVVNQPQGEVILSARSVPNGVKLRWAGSHAAYTVYRDGVPILSTTATECADWLTTGRHRYQVRGINSRLYSLSNEVYEYSVSNWGGISPVNSIDWLSLRFRSGSSAETSAGTSRQMVLQYLAGRAKPVAEVSEQLTVEHSFEYSLSDFSELERLRAMVGQTVICKGKEGPAVIGILTAVNDTSDWASVDVSFTITEIDYKEGGGLENH